MPGEPSESLPSAKRAKSPAASVAKLIDEVRFLTTDTDTVYRHNGAFWEELSNAALRQIALAHDLAKSTKSRRGEFIDELKAQTHIRGLEWGRVADYEVPFKNGVLDVRTGALRTHRPEDYLERVLPWVWDPGATAPTWLRVLDDWFAEDEGDQAGPIAALQEFFGYVCLSHARWKKALLVYGPSDSGKSLIPFLLALIVGRDRVASLPLEKMDDPQERAAIVGKALNLLTEVTASALIADGGFKAMISTEEPVHINEKYKPPFAYWPTAKHCFVTNNLPGMSDRTEGVLNRLLVVPMLRVLPKDKQDEELQAKLEAELAGILVWSVQGAQRLVAARGKFTEVASGAEVLDDLRRRANPVIDFLRERLKKSETAALPLDHVATAYRRWRGNFDKTTTKGLGAMLRAAGAVTKVIHQRDTKAGTDRVVTCLIGYEFDARAVPDLFVVSAADAASSAREITDATAIVQPEGPPP